MAYMAHSQEWPEAQHFEVHASGGVVGVEANKVNSDGAGVSFYLNGEMVGAFKPGTEWSISPSPESRVSTPESRGDYG